MPDLSFLDKFYQFYHLNPAGALFILACGLTVFRKIMRHITKGSNYTLRDLRKYPGEALELILILAALLGSVYFFLKG